jgi:ribosomal 30S subunit maturation factor RimM
MRTILIASSALALVAAPGFAQSQAQDPANQPPSASDERNGLFDGWFENGHPLEGLPVYTRDGERVGSVERVRGGAGPDADLEVSDGRSEPLDVDALVVETGGFLGIGAREVDIDPGQAELTSVDGDERIILDISNAEFERLREHARDRDAGLGGDSGEDRAWRDGERDASNLQRQEDALTDAQTRAEQQSRLESEADPQRQDDAWTETQRQMDGQDTVAGQTRAQAQAADADEARDWSADAAEPYSGSHEWVGMPVYSSDGDRLGEVHKVRALPGADGFGGEQDPFADEADPRDGQADPMRDDMRTQTGAPPPPATTGGAQDVSAIIVRTGGFLGIGRREVRVEGNLAALRTEGSEPRVVINMSQDAFNDLPEYERNGDRTGG